MKRLGKGYYQRVYKGYEILFVKHHYGWIAKVTKMGGSLQLRLREQRTLGDADLESLYCVDRLVEINNGFIRKDVNYGFIRKIDNVT